MDRKFFAILVQYWDQSQRQAVTRFLVLPVCNIATAEALFESLSNEIESHGIPWLNMHLTPPVSWWVYATQC